MNRTGWKSVLHWPLVVENLKPVHTHDPGFAAPVTIPNSDVRYTSTSLKQGENFNQWRSAKTIFSAFKLNGDILDLSHFSDWPSVWRCESWQDLNLCLNLFVVHTASSLFIPNCMIHYISTLPKTTAMVVPNSGRPCCHSNALTGRVTPAVLNAAAKSIH